MADYSQMLHEIISHLGGVENIKSVTHCATRLRFALKDGTKADMAAIDKQDGVLGTQVSAGTYQVLIGTHVGDVYDEIIAIPGIKGNGEVDEELGEDAPTEKLGLFDRFTRMVSAVYAPYIPILATGGIASGVVGLMSNFGILATDSLTYQAFYAIFYALINFFPIMLAYTAAQYFKCNQYVAAALGAALMYPGVSDLLVAGQTANLFGINFPAFNFAGSFVPILLAVFCMSHMERWLKKVLPKSAQFTLVPVCCLFVFVPLTIMVFGPIGSVVANGIAGVYAMLSDYTIPTGIIFGAFFSLVILLGMHWAVLPIQLAVLAEQGSEFSLAAGGMGNYAVLGICLAVFALSKETEDKQIAGSASLALGLCGISEPCLYGVILKDKRYIVAMCLAGGVAGLLQAVLGVACTNFAFAGLLSFGGWLGCVNLPGYIASIVVSVGLGFIFGAMVLKARSRKIA